MNGSKHIHYRAKPTMLWIRIVRVTFKWLESKIDSANYFIIEGKGDETRAKAGLLSSQTGLSQGCANHGSVSTARRWDSERIHQHEFATDERREPSETGLSYPFTNWGMASVPDESAFEERYHAIKKKYDELYNLRVTSVRTDSEDLRQKIEEHRRIHEIAVRELRTQNEELAQSGTRRSSIDRDIRRLEDSIGHVKHELQARDSVLNAFLKYPDFRVTITEKGVYHISWGNRDQLQFTLTRDEHAGKLLFTSIKTPAELQSCQKTDFVNLGRLTFEQKSVGGFCQTLRDGIEQCGLGRFSKSSRS
jgi:hypothetical protein